MDAPAKESRARLLTIPTSDVVVDGRHRQDMGDLAELRKSIERVGLLHPIVIMKDKRLVAGYRRLTAFKQMARKSIQAVVVENLADATALLTAERDENICRKDFTPSEAVAMGKALEELERPKAEARKAAGQKSGGRGNKKLGEKFTSSLAQRHSTREVVGSAVGMSGPTYQRAKAVVDAAEAEPEKYAELRDEMDRTGKVTGVYRKLIQSKPLRKTKAKKKKKPPRLFRDGDFVSLCEQLTDWMQRRADRLGGLEDHAECVKLFAQYQRRIELWQEYKPA